jgi:cytoskeletal protein CcmA (bactofilin family)
MASVLEPQIRNYTGTPESTPDSNATEGASESVIDRHSHFNGLYRTARDLRIEGTAEGEIECEGTVTVAEDARATATVRARNVIIAGSASGEITCGERFTIRPTGEVRGQVQAASLVVEEGAFFEGEFKMAANEGGEGGEARLAQTLAETETSEPSRPTRWAFERTKTEDNSEESDSTAGSEDEADTDEK